MEIGKAVHIETITNRSDGLLQLPSMSLYNSSVRSLLVVVKCGQADMLTWMLR